INERRSSMPWDNLVQDVRYALRSCAKAPSFTIAVLATVALGIGASTAIFSMVNGVLIRPLPLPDPDRLVYATEVDPHGGSISVSWPDYLDWRARTRSYDALSLSREEPMTLTGLDGAQRIRTRRVTGSFFQALGVAPAIGRTLNDQDDRPNA